MTEKFISDSIKYIGVDDPDLTLFESQYVLENGMAYNSYLIDDEKVCLHGFYIFVAIIKKMSLTVENV